jgi:hypothetical protein
MIASTDFCLPLVDPREYPDYQSLPVIPLFSVSLPPLETHDEVALLLEDDTMESTPHVSSTADMHWCIPCGKALPLNNFYPSAINTGVKRCRSCANTLVYASWRRERVRNPRRQFVASVQRRVKDANGDNTPNWIGTAGVVQSILEAAGWKSALGGSLRGLTLIQRDPSVGQWEPHHSMCVTTKEALVFPSLFQACMHMH